MSKPVSYKLFKKASNGKLQEWSIEVDTEGGRFRTSDGYVGGAITTTAWTQCEAVNVGKANATTPQVQAQKEANSKITKQKKKGWTESEADVDSAARKVLPMLARKFEDEIDKAIEAGEELAVQPKLDGIRALGADDAMHTKEGGIHGQAGDHIFDHVQELQNGLPTGVYLDGEFYNHEYKADFNAITSMVRKQTLTPELLKKTQEKLEYHLYDMCMNGDFRTRFATLNTLVNNQPNDKFKIVPTVFIQTKGLSKADIYAELDHWHKKFVNDGYEGSMVRIVNSEYKASTSRAKQLMKRKDWIDDEFALVDIVSGKGNREGWAASVVCIDARGESFDAGVIGNEAYCRELLANKKNYIGKMVTIKYQNLTPDRKVPRFGKMKTIL